MLHDVGLTRQFPTTDVFCVTVPLLLPFVQHAQRRRDHFQRHTSAPRIFVQISTAYFGGTDLHCTFLSYTRIPRTQYISPRKAPHILHPPPLEPRPRFGPSFPPPFNIHTSALPHTLPHQTQTHVVFKPNPTHTRDLPTRAPHS